MSSEAGSQVSVSTDSEHILVMISGRNQTMVGGRPTLEIRRAIANRLQQEVLGSTPIITCWIDAERAQSMARTWSVCRDAARRCTVFLAVLTGEVGDLNLERTTGICEAELVEARLDNKDKVAAIRLTPDPIQAPKSEDEARLDGEFDGRLRRETFWCWPLGADSSLEQIVDAGVRQVLDVIQKLARRGALVSSNRPSDGGETLEWSRLIFRQRQDRMLTELVGNLEQAGLRVGATEDELGDGKLVAHPLGACRVLLWAHAVPGSFGVSAARELITRPLARETIAAKWLGELGGPVHVIAVHRNVTAGQVSAFFGTPDLYLVDEESFIYAADLTSLQQSVFLKKCTDPASIRRGVDIFFGWLRAIGEDRKVADMAMRRAQIVALLAQQLTEIRDTTCMGLPRFAGQIR